MRGLPLVTATAFAPSSAHAEDVEALTAHVLLAHVDGAVETEERARGGGGDSVLARACFGDDAAFAHAAREQRLTETIIDFVSAGVEQVFALDVDFGSERVREAAREIERRGASGVGGEKLVEFGVESRVTARFVICDLKFFERRHQNFGSVTAAVSAEVSA